MGTYKVDICGVNTSKLPILKEAENIFHLCSTDERPLSRTVF